MWWNNKVAIVTGGAQGIGKEISLHLAKKGVKVAIFDIQDTQTVSNAIQENGQTPLCLKTDVSKSHEVNKSVKKVADKFGRIDVLVSNAGIGHLSKVEDMSDEDLDEMLNVHLKGAFYCSRAVLPLMLKQRSGRIVYISSIAGSVIGWSREAHYSAAKAGLVGLTKTLAKEVGPYNITVNAISPGIIDTPLNEPLGQKEVTELLKYVPLGRIGNPIEIAGTVIFLASEEASYITGQNIIIDGGLTTWYHAARSV